MLRQLSGLPLMADAENQHGVVFCLEAVERGIACPAARYQELALNTIKRATDQGVELKHGDGVGYEIDGRRGGGWVLVTKKIDKSQQIVQRSPAIGYVRHFPALGAGVF